MPDVASVLAPEVLKAKALVDQHALHDALRRGDRVMTVNLFHLVLFERDETFAKAFLSADGWTADGWPVQLLWRLAGTRAMRLTGSGLCRGLVGEDGSVVPGRRIALIGSRESTGDAFAGLLSSQGRTLVLREHRRVTDWDVGGLAAAVRKAGADLVLVAAGAPFCEVFAAALRRSVPTAVVGVGGGVDMATGAQRAAPPSVSRARLEWLWRLAHDPARLWRRYLLDCLPFLLLRAPAAVRRARRTGSRR